MKLIAGLGNPGRTYEHTRHNVGFDVIDILAERMNIRVDSEKHHGLTGSGFLAGQKVMLVKPQTYMNLSGECLSPLAHYFDVAPEDVIVICDDINLKLGQLRIRGKGSAGGHNGLKNIIQHLGGENFPRIRCGVGMKPERMDLADFVLAHFSSLEREALDVMEHRAADAIELLLADGVSMAMTKYNKKVEVNGEEL